MATTIQKQVATINACAAHFALRSYHVEVSLYPNTIGCSCTIFFDDVKRRERITRILRCFADEGDKIEFKALPYEWRTIYTLTLKKDVVL